MVQAALCGSAAGCVAGAITTPLDVTKTRLMLEQDQRSGMLQMMQRIYVGEGPGALFRGILPRLAWISCGGAVFLGCYEHATRQLIDRL